MSHLTYSSDANFPDESSSPEHIGRYQLIGRLAKGGMAEAYLALAGEMSGLRSLVVVKRILPHLSSNEQFVRMFFDEARIGALLDHPNIVRIIEVAHDRDGYFLVMEPVQGKPLSAVLRRAAKRKSPLGHAQAAFIVGQAADGLGYAHGLADAEGRLYNVVHRDVSPENILVSFEGAVKVIDFGIASALGRLTRDRARRPQGEDRVHVARAGLGRDRRSALRRVRARHGVVGGAVRAPAVPARPRRSTTMRAIVDEPIPRPSRIAPVSPRLERIVMRALEKDPRGPVPGRARDGAAAAAARVRERRLFPGPPRRPDEAAVRGGSRRLEGDRGRRARDRGRR